jgi:Rod binding domain-containing protein
MPDITATSGSPPTDLERLKNSPGGTVELEKARLRKVTKEFESFFLYYMLKTMRETLTADPAKEEAPMTGSMGKDTYQQMFDMEVSRGLVRGGNRSLSDMLYKSMEKLVEARFKSQDNASSTTEPAGANQIQKSREMIPLEKAATPRDLHRQLQFQPIDRTSGPTFSPVKARRTVTAAPDPIRSQFGKIIDEASHANQLDSSLIRSVIKAESNGDPQAVSAAGAKGLMQLADSTASDLGVDDPFDARANVMGGSKYLRSLIDRFGDLNLALAAYNAGPSTVQKHGGVPPFRETQDYITRVNAYLKESRAGEAGPLK